MNFNLPTYCIGFIYNNKRSFQLITITICIQFAIIRTIQQLKPFSVDEMVQSEYLSRLSGLSFYNFKNVWFSSKFDAHSTLI